MANVCVLVQGPSGTVYSLWEFTTQGNADAATATLKATVGTGMTVTEIVANAAVDTQPPAGSSDNL